MSLVPKIKYHGLKFLRMAWYQCRYRLSKWKTIEGIRLPVYLNYGYPVLRFIDNAEYEQHELVILKLNLQAGDKVLELGTGIGFISAYCSKILGGENVFTFEGNPAQSELIKELYQGNDVAPIMQIAMLGKGTSERAFRGNSKNFLASSVVDEDILATNKIPQLDLNDVIGELKPNYLVMDIEGGEYDIFKMIDFQMIQKIQFEMHPAVLRAQQVSEIFELLRAANFHQAPPLDLPNNYFFVKMPAELNRDNN